jgi:hypothetical protein
MKRTMYPPGLPVALWSQWDWYKNTPTAARHRGVTHYDRERMRQVLQQINHGNSFETYAAPPSFVILPDSWGPWEPVPANHFHNGCCTPEPARADGAERVTEDYTLQRIAGDHPWQATFADGVFTFRTLAIAEAGITELLRRRMEKHPKPDTLSKRTASQVFFTAKRQRELPEDIYIDHKPRCEQPAAA